MKKRALSLVLAFVLVFTVSATALAAPAGIATVQIIAFEEEVETFEIASGVSLYDTIVENFGSDDATYGDFYPEWNWSNDFYWPSQPVVYMTSFLMLDSMFVDYYEDIVNGGWIYESYDWKYTVNGTAPVFGADETPAGETFYPDHEKALNQYVVQDGDVIVLDYELWVEIFN